MKVLQVISYSPLYLSEGPPNVAFGFSKELAARGHEVTVFSTDTSRMKSRLKIQNNPVLVEDVTIFHFRNLSNQMANRNLPLALDMAIALKRRIEDFDLVHLHEYRTLNAAFVHYCSIKKKIPFVLQPHGSLSRICTDAYERLRLRSAFDLLFGASILRDANLVIAVQEKEATQFRQIGVDEHRIRIVPNAINTADYENLPEEGIFRRKYGLAEEDLIVLFLGRINKLKGPDLGKKNAAISAFQQIVVLNQSEDETPESKSRID
jgi:glycosyltransferase involved in cell wall biosynthesis